MRKADCPTGIIHVHTAASADGLLDVDDIAQMCRDRGLSFAAITDHAEDMNEERMNALVRACDEHSKDSILLIPGLEHRYMHGVHVLALGQRRLIRTESALSLFQALLSEKCVLVAAHCAAHEDLPASMLEILSAVEIWNVSRHTRYLPISGCLNAYRRWAAEYPNLYAIGGLDMHRGHEWGCEVVLNRTCGLTEDSVLAALRTGEFITKGRLLSFGSRPTGGVRALAFTAGDALAGVRDARDRVLGASQIYG